MKRLVLDKLRQWKSSTDRKPLILRGARQVGKTWLLKEFGKQCFDEVCYVNFEESHSLDYIFQGDNLSPFYIIDQLSIFHGKRIHPNKTLIILDEIQEMPRALTALKYFEETAPEYAICCAGSLLGVALHEGTSFPVGKVDFLDMYPMTFKEFLLASGEELLVEYISSSHREYYAFLSKLHEYLKEYFIVGGMPAAVSKWIKTRDFNEVEKVQRNLILAYESDFSKHAPKEHIEKIRYVWNSISSQLAKENKKFVYGLVRKGARAREYEDAILWLKDAGEIIKTYCITKPDLPLRAYTDLKSFKIYLLDVGLLRVLSGLDPRVLLQGNRIFEEFKGALTEQFVCQELQQFDKLQCQYYWTSGATAEVDFIISDGLDVYPLEVKSGNVVNAKSLKIYSEKYSPSRVFRTSLLPYEKNETLTNIPLYLLFILDQELPRI